MMLYCKRTHSQLSVGVVILAVTVLSSCIHVTEALPVHTTPTPHRGHHGKSLRHQRLQSLRMGAEDEATRGMVFSPKCNGPQLAQTGVGSAMCYEKKDEYTGCVSGAVPGVCFGGTPPASCIFGMKVAYEEGKKMSSKLSIEGRFTVAVELGPMKVYADINAVGAIEFKAKDESLSLFDAIRATAKYLYNPKASVNFGKLLARTEAFRKQQAKVMKRAAKQGLNVMVGDYQGSIVYDVEHDIMEVLKKYKQDKLYSLAFWNDVYKKLFGLNVALKKEDMTDLEDGRMYPSDKIKCSGGFLARHPKLDKILTTLKLKNKEKYFEANDDDVLSVKQLLCTAAKEGLLLNQETLNEFDGNKQSHMILTVQEWWKEATGNLDKGSQLANSERQAFLFKYAGGELKGTRGWLYSIIFSDKDTVEAVFNDPDQPIEKASLAFTFKIAVYVGEPSDFPTVCGGDELLSVTLGSLDFSVDKNKKKSVTYAGPMITTSFKGLVSASIHLQKLKAGAIKTSFKLPFSSSEADLTGIFKTAAGSGQVMKILSDAAKGIKGLFDTIEKGAGTIMPVLSGLAGALKSIPDIIKAIFAGKKFQGSFDDQNKISASGKKASIEVVKSVMSTITKVVIGVAGQALETATGGMVKLGSELVFELSFDWDFDDKMAVYRLTCTTAQELQIAKGGFAGGAKASTAHSLAIDLYALWNV